MGIRCYCPNGHGLNVKELLAGKTGICPVCGAKFQIPAVSPRETPTKKRKPVQTKQSRVGDIRDPETRLREWVSLARQHVTLLEEAVGSLERIRSARALLRLALATACLLLALVIVWFLPSTFQVPLLLCVPLAIGAAITLGRLDHAVWAINGLNGWAEQKRYNGSSQTGWFHRFFTKPFAAGIGWIDRRTQLIQNDYARAGASSALSLYYAGGWIGIAAMVVALAGVALVAVLYVVIGVLVTAVIIGILLKLISE